MGGGGDCVGMAKPELEFGSIYLCGWCELIVFNFLDDYETLKLFKS